MLVLSRWGRPVWPGLSKTKRKSRRYIKIAMKDWETSYLAWDVLTVDPRKSSDWCGRNDQSVSALAQSIPTSHDRFFRRQLFFLTIIPYALKLPICWASTNRHSICVLIWHSDFSRPACCSRLSTTDASPLDRGM